jgi:hypothetical protein
MTGIFMSLSRVLPDHYPLGNDVERYVADEHGLGQTLDVGVIVPRLRQLYDWSADELRLPALSGLLDRETPSYAWDVTDAAIWQFEPSRLARAARRLIPHAAAPLR